jgi:hypothetical protein
MTPDADIVGFWIVAVITISAGIAFVYRDRTAPALTAAVRAASECPAMA